MKNTNEKNDDEGKENAGNVNIGTVGCIYVHYIRSQRLFKNGMENTSISI